MKALHEILAAPHLTEKTAAYLMDEATNKYVFKVKLDANKFEIKSAVEQRFDVEVVAVNTVVVRGKIKRLRQKAGKRPNWKKAYITLKDGNTISEFEGA
jgi:large subunit ribosomal protein L23